MWRDDVVVVGVLGSHGMTSLRQIEWTSHSGFGRSRVRRPVLVHGAYRHVPRTRGARHLSDELPWVVLCNAGNVERRNDDVAEIANRNDDVEASFELSS